MAYVFKKDNPYPLSKGEPTLLNPEKRDYEGRFWTPWILVLGFES
jgi:hypothetical protein